VTPAKTPAYTRLDVDERRRRLLEVGAELFATHAYQELSMADIARAAGISKALLYHYFPSKQAFLRAVLGQFAGEVAALTEPDPGKAPLEQLSDALDAFLAWVGANGLAYRKLLQSAGGVPEVGELIERVRRPTAERILAGITVPGEAVVPAARAAVAAWLWFMDGAILDWLEHDDFDRDQLRGLLIGTLLGALASSGASVALD
jgi:AcrR family transcriptional regulator